MPRGLGGDEEEEAELPSVGGEVGGSGEEAKQRLPQMRRRRQGGMVTQPERARREPRSQPRLDKTECADGRGGWNASGIRMMRVEAGGLTESSSRLSPGRRRRAAKATRAVRGGEEAALGHSKQRT